MSLDLRARAAVAMLELAFNPHQRRDSRGRWTKMPDSELKRPRRSRRTAEPETPAPASPRQLSDVLEWLKTAPQFLDPEDLPTDVREWAEEMFAYDDPVTGFKSRVTRVLGNGGPTRQNLDLAIEITDETGKKVGLARRRLRAVKGANQVDHVSFYLDKKGTGFSSRWLRQMEDRYREAGIEQEWLIASEVGSYAWAKAGFDFVDREQAQLAASRVAAILRTKDAKRDLPQRVITDGNELVRRARESGAEIPTPMEFAMLGWTPGAETWPGKQALLNVKGGKPRGVEWEGIKRL